MKRLFVAAVLAASLSLLPATAVAQDNFQVKDATSTTITKSAKKLSDGSLADKNVMIGADGVEKGTATNPQAVMIVGTPAVTISALPAFTATPTVNVGTMPSVTIGTSALPAGAATAAGQASMITALGSPYQAGGALPLPTGAATQTTLAGVLTALQTTLKVDTVVQATSVDRGASVGTTAVGLMVANASRRGFAIQNQSTSAKIYINGLVAATADYHSLMVPPLGYYETPPGHVGTSAISIISDTAATPVYAREW